MCVFRQALYMLERCLCCEITISLFLSSCWYEEQRNNGGILAFYSCLPSHKRQWRHQR